MEHHSVSNGGRQSRRGKFKRPVRSCNKYFELLNEYAYFDAHRRLEHQRSWRGRRAVKPGPGKEKRTSLASSGCEGEDLRANECGAAENGCNEANQAQKL
jgi:hypothetical protein